MIDWSLVRLVCSPDPLEEAKAKVQTREIRRITRERYEEMHRGALQRLAGASVPSRGVEA